MEGKKTIGSSQPSIPYVLIGKKLQEQLCWKIITRAVVLVYKRDKSKNGERELITFRGVEFPLR